MAYGRPYRPPHSRWHGHAPREEICLLRCRARNLETTVAGTEAAINAVRGIAITVRKFKTRPIAPKAVSLRNQQLKNCHNVCVPSRDRVLMAEAARFRDRRMTD